MLKKFGVEGTYMLTGDNASAAEKIAAECGLDGFYASLMPEDKVEKVEEIKKSGVTVFTGDGINDAPVLAAADVGAAISISKKTMECVKQNVIFIMAVKVLVLVLGALGYAPIWLAVFADVGVCLLAVLWSLRLLKIKA